MLGIIGKKLGMTQIYREDGSVIPVTAVFISPNVVVDVKTQDKCGYGALQVASNPQKESRLNKPKQGHFKKQKVDPCQLIKEFRTDRVSDFKVGMKLTADALEVGQKVNVQGRSKGKGFQGVMKIYNFRGGCDSHGNSVSHRVPGSIGQGTYPGRVIKGSKLPRHMGDETISVKNLEIVGVEGEQNIVLIKGALPGSSNSHLYIYPQNKDFEDKVLSLNTKDEPTKPEGDKQESKEKGEEAAA